MATSAGASKFDDLGTDGSLSKTFPFLSCVASCSGFGPDGQNMTNCVDQYCPPGTLLSSFSFGTISNTTWTSFSMGLNETVPTCHNWTEPATTNPDILSDVAGDPNVCPKIANATERFRMALDCSVAAGPGIRTIIIRFGSCPNNGINTNFGELFKAGPILGKFPGTHTQNVVQTPNVTLPKRLDFVCVPFCIQGFCGNGPGLGGILSNAMSGQIGV